MRKLVALVGAAAIALLVAAPSSADAPAVTPAISAPAAKPALTPAESQYVATMVALDSAWFDQPMSDADYVAGGRGFCENEIPAGLTWASLRATLDSHGLSDHYSYFRVSIRAAAAAFCPEFLPIRNG